MIEHQLSATQFSIEAISRLSSGDRPCLISLRVDGENRLISYFVAPEKKILRYFGVDTYAMFLRSSSVGNADVFQRSSVRELLVSGGFSTKRNVRMFSPSQGENSFWIVSDIGISARPYLDQMLREYESMSFIGESDVAENSDVFMAASRVVSGVGHQLDDIKLLNQAGLSAIANACAGRERELCGLFLVPSSVGKDELIRLRYSLRMLTELEFPCFELPLSLSLALVSEPPPLGAPWANMAFDGFGLREEGTFADEIRMSLSRIRRKYPIICACPEDFGS